MGLEYFIGNFKIERSENFDEYLKQVGVNSFWRKAYAASKSFLRGEGIYDSATDTWTLKANVGPLSHNMVFKIGVPFEDKQYDGRIAKAIMHRTEENVLVENLTWEDGTTAVITRKYAPKSADFIFKSGDVVAKMIWKKVE